MRRQCDICGSEQDDYWMKPFNTGKKTMWLCWGCFKQSQREAQLSDLYRQKKLYAIHQGKKRNK